MGTPDWQGRYPDVWRHLHKLDNGSAGFDELSQALWSDIDLAASWLAAPDARYREWRSGADRRDAAQAASEAADSLIQYLLREPVLATGAVADALQKAGFELSAPSRRPALRLAELRNGPGRMSRKGEAFTIALTALRDGLRSAEVAFEGPRVIGALAYEKPPREKMSPASVVKRGVLFGSVVRLRHFYDELPQPTPGEFALMPVGRTPAGILPIAITLTEAALNSAGCQLENEHAMEEFLRKLRKDNPNLAFVGWPPEQHTPEI